MGESAPVSFDVLEVFPVEIREMIFQHLSSKALLDLTLVSTIWNDFIKINLKVMEDFNIHICGIRFLSTMETINAAWEVLKRNKFKRVTLSFLVFPSLRNLNDLLGIFEQSTENLMLSVIHLEPLNQQEPNETLNFHNFNKLRNLWIKNCANQNIASLFTRCKKLQFFEFDEIPKGEDGSSKSILDILKQQKDLKKFICKKKGIAYEFFNSTDFSFQIEEFKIIDEDAEDEARDELNSYGRYLDRFRRSQRKITKYEVSVANRHYSKSFEFSVQYI